MTVEGLLGGLALGLWAMAQCGIMTKEKIGKACGVDSGLSRQARVVSLIERGVGKPREGRRHAQKERLGKKIKEHNAKAEK